MYVRMCVCMYVCMYVCMCVCTCVSVPACVCVCVSFYRRCRKDEVVVCRARISHTHLTYSYILRTDPPPQCEQCQCILRVRHILVECNHFSEKKGRIYLVKEM